MSQKKKPGQLASDLVDSLLDERVNSKKASKAKQNGLPQGENVDPVETDETKSFILEAETNSSVFPPSAQVLAEGSIKATNEPVQDPFLDEADEESEVDEISIPFVNFKGAITPNPFAPSGAPQGKAKASESAGIHDEEATNLQTLEFKKQVTGSTAVTEHAARDGLSGSRKTGEEPGGFDELTGPASERPVGPDVGSPTEISEEATRALTQVRDKLNAAFKGIGRKKKSIEPDATEVIGVAGPQNIGDKEHFERSLADHKIQTAVRFGQGRMSKNKHFPVARGSGGVLAASEATLAQSESLRFAQDRIIELEKEVDRLRRENEQLAAAGETLGRRLDEALAGNESMQIEHQESLELHLEERKSLREAVQNRRVEAELLQRKVDELEIRLASDLKKIRVRERELENRLELLKMEGAALLRSKDEMILELKREVDKLSGETENYRHKNQDLHRQIDGDQDKFRRTVRALRLALSMLESEEENVVAMKKAK
jgi:hypothetical protein